ncbi:lipopolysaccharide biosynthesis protein [Ureibacillus manganicus]|uniref:Polysaccharide biosynthesis protein n=1 Tax=Ureibacillus manganicus DSM 26584 TaxID=1384049 RepID=A0A0A3HY88_9BACL|nr:oligosaccharide flippase family protein [Ureibacillus manganicus]KGR76200.1 hypothetical protein CD29_17080 [Ureibacillus manganicus DSM 26584]
MKSLLIKNFSWSFFGNIVYALSQWVLLIIITRAGSSYDAGVYSLGLAITAPFILLVNLNFTAIQSTNLQVQFGFLSFKFIRLLGNLSFFIVFSIILIMSSYDFNVSIVLLLIALVKVVESVSDLYYGLFQYNERLDLVAISVIKRGLIGTLLFGIGYYFFNELSVALIFILIYWFINLLFYDSKKGNKLLKRMPKSKHSISMWHLVKLGIPLGIAACIASFNVNIPRIFLENYLTFEDLGYFSAVFYMVLIIGKFMTSLASAFLPRLARLYEKNDLRSFTNILKIIILMLLILYLLIMNVTYFFGSELLGLIYGEEYKHLRKLLMLIIFYGLLNYLGFVFETGLNAMKEYRFRMVCEVLVSSVIIGGCFYFIPQFSLIGAAVVLIIAAAVKCSFLISLFLVQFLKKRRGAYY